MRIRRLLVSVRKRRSGMGAGLLLSLAGHGLAAALLLMWSDLHNVVPLPKFALIVDLVEDLSPGADAPEQPAGPAPAAATPAAPPPTAATDTKTDAPTPKAVETPRADPAAGSEAPGGVGDLLRGVEAAHTGASPSTGTAGGVFDAADAGGTGSASLEDFIRVQITRRWQIAPNAPDTQVRLMIRIIADGSILAVTPMSEAGEDRVLQAVITAARNAALLSSPLQFPRGTLSVSGDLVITLNTRDARR